MTEQITPDTLIRLFGQWTILDVRAPLEYAKGHIPSAINLPLFTDEERAKVGTTYKQQGRQEAIWQGLDIVGAKMRPLAEQMHQQSKDKPLLIHCWRGGMRSEFMAWLADKVDLDTAWLQGGYKGFRRCILEQLATPKKIAILGGKTGAGKTELLQELAKAGQPIIDLEALANHRGSAFGGLGKGEQPSQQSFENALGLQWAKCPADQTIWIENESRMIGRIHLPQPFWEQMKQAPLYSLEVPLEVRTKRIVEEYGIYPTEALEEAIQHIKKRMPPDAYQEAITALHDGNLSHCFQRLLETYYDKFYDYGLQKRLKTGVSFVAYREDLAAQIDELNKARRKTEEEENKG